jgi:Uma2 family endonuclease
MSSVGLLPRRMTYAEWLLQPEDGPRIELYDGEVWEMPAPSFIHQDVAANTLHAFREYAERVGGVAVGAPFDIVFSERNVVQPDVVFFLPQRKHLIKLREPTRYRPDIAVEILSPTTKSNDRGRKLRMFARYEVPEYWILDADERTVEIHSLRGSFYEVAMTASGDGVVTSPLLPDLSFPLARIFKSSLD